MKSLLTSRRMVLSWNSSSKPSKHVREIIEELAATHPDSGEPQQIANFYNSWMNTEAANAKVVITAADLKSINAATSKNELAVALGHLLATGVGTFFGIDVDTDLNNPSATPLSSTSQVSGCRTGFTIVSHNSRMCWQSIASSFPLSCSSPTAGREGCLHESRNGFRI